MRSPAGSSTPITTGARSSSATLTFLGADDPYNRLKTALWAEIGESAWASLYSAASRSFPRPSSGRIAVKVINHYGDEVLKVDSV